MLVKSNLKKKKSVHLTINVLLAILSDGLITKFVRNFYRDAGDSLNDCRIMFVTEIYKIEEPGSSDGPGASSDSPLKSESDFSTEHTL